MKTGQLFPIANFWFTLPGLSKEENRNLRARYAGEYRAPKKGEWFLSGAIVEAYRASVDMNTAYHIAELVVAEPAKPVVTHSIRKVSANTERNLYYVQ